MYQSTMRGTSVRPRAPPNADPFQTRPVTSWKDVSQSLTRARHADDDRHAPAAVATLERLPHQLNTADALEAVIGAAAGQFDQMRHQVAFHLGWIDKVGQAKAASDRLTRGGLCRRQ